MTKYEAMASFSKPELATSRRSIDSKLIRAYEAHLKRKIMLEAGRSKEEANAYYDAQMRKIGIKQSK